MFRMSNPTLCNPTLHYATKQVLFPMLVYYGRRKLFLWWGEVGLSKNVCHRGGLTTKKKNTG